MTDFVKGKGMASVEAVSVPSVLQMLGGLPLGKEHCADIAASALRAAVTNYRETQVLREWL